MSTCLVCKNRIRSRLTTTRLMILSACLALLASTSYAQGLPEGDPQALGFSTARLHRVENIVAGAVAREEIAGAVALIARRGEIAYLQTFGMADIDDQEPMEVDTIFRIASMTKPVTSLAVMMLYEEGHFLLSDPVSDYIPELKNLRVLTTGSDNVETVAAESEITIRQLLTHTSGISYRFISSGDKRETIARLYAEAGVSDGLSETEGRIADLSRQLGELPLLFEPGEQFAYGLSIDVLGHLVEVVSGMTLTEYFDSQIFEPLAMVDTHFYLDDNKVGRLASVYTSTEDGGMRELGNETVVNDYLVYSATYPYSGPGSYYSGGAGLVSTISDYVRLLQMFLNGGELDGIRLLSPTTVAMMTRNNIGDLDVGPGTKFGLGFAVLEDPGLAGNPGSVGTYFWGGFFNTQFFVDPEEELIGVIMTQRFPADRGNVRQKFVNGAYQALVD